MFVKFVYYPSSKNEKCFESIKECDSCDFDYTADALGGFFNLELNGRDIPRIEIDLKDTVVYVMSSSGKTIDKYRWVEDGCGVFKRK